jgi:hypothetical protein
VSSLELRHDVVILACAISAGIHAALVPDHVDEGAGVALGFAVATVLLGAFAVALTLQPARVLVLTGAAAFLAGLILSYAFAITTGLPVLHPDPEPVDGLALATKAIEIAGLVAALDLVRRGRQAVAATAQPKGTLT